MWWLLVVAIRQWKKRSFLTRYVNHVTVIHRRDTLRASKIMQDRARNNPKISFILESEVQTSWVMTR